MRESKLRENAASHHSRGEAPLPCIEALPARLLFAVVEYDAPTTASVVHLRKNLSLGQVEVWLDNASTAAYTFTGTSDTDKIVAGTATQFISDEVPADFKPTGGILVVGYSENTLQVTAGAADGMMALTRSSSAGGLIATYDPSTDIVGTDSYDAAVKHLIMLTTATSGTEVDVAADNHSAGAAVETQ